jgi:integrase
MTVHLTDSAITKAVRECAATKTRRDISDAACPGLRLRLTAAGVKSWVLACRDRLGRMRRFPLGSYPDMGIAVARDAARTLRVKVRDEGADPVAARRRDRAMGAAARSGVGTLKAILDAYGGPGGGAPASWALGKSRVELVLKSLLGTPAAAIVAADIQAEADRYPLPKTASFVVRTVRPGLKWAAERGMCSEALATLKQRTAPTRRQRVLSRAELAALLPVLRAAKRPYAAALRFMLLTLARREEVAGMQRQHLDLKAATWTIPGSLTKNGEHHVVPLSRQALELLAALPPPARRPAAAGPAPDLVFRNNAGTRLRAWDRETKAIMSASQTNGWTRHDLRRTGATMMGEAGVIPDIIEAALNHITIRSPLAATYNRSRYRPQVAAALQALADELDGIEKETEKGRDKALATTTPAGCMRPPADPTCPRTGAIRRSLKAVV